MYKQDHLASGMFVYCVVRYFRATLTRSRRAAARCLRGRRPAFNPPAATTLTTPHSQPTGKSPGSRRPQRSTAPAPL